jgi:chemotaxis protein MotB
MAREKSPPPDTTGEIPKWFMTYSDVITLLMTFFILLLTFASKEPERFERMKVSAFGGKGSVGMAGDNLEALDNEALLVRTRPKHSRLTMRGTEIPPMHSDPVVESLNEGLKSLEETNDLAQLERFSFDVPLSSFVDDSGNLTDIARQHLRLFASQMKRIPLTVKFEVADEADLEPVMEMCQVLANGFRVPSGSVAAGIAGTRPPRGLRIVFTREL